MMHRERPVENDQRWEELEQKQREKNWVTLGRLCTTVSVPFPGVLCSVPWCYNGVCVYA